MNLMWSERQHACPNGHSITIWVKAKILYAVRGGMNLACFEMTQIFREICALHLAKKNELGKTLIKR